MRTLLVALSLLCVSLLEAQDLDVQHYNFEIGLSDQHDTVSGKATIQVKFAHMVDQLQFDLKGISKGKGMQLLAVEENGKMLEYYHTNDKVIIKLTRGTKAGELASFVIRYKGIPSDGLIISKNKYGHRTFFADNWPNRGHNWLPCVDEPGDKATVEFIVTAPAHYQVVSNGIQVEETNVSKEIKRTHWKETVPVSTKVMVIGVADFAVNLSGMVNNCIPVYSWVYPEDRDKGFYDYAQAAEILPYFIERVGPYAYQKLANVESKTIFGGLENANTIFYSESSINGQRKSEALLAHEIAHQWFGNMATEKTFAHLWLSEGFATYMTILYMENKYGVDTASFMLQEDRRQVVEFAKRSRLPVVNETADYMSLLNANSYQKGGWVLHMLRRELGDQVFWKSIRAYYQQYAGGTADTEDLQKVFETNSGKELGYFFKQWLYTPGVPRLTFTWNYIAAEKKIEITITQRQASPFRFPLSIRITDTNGKSRIEKIQITETTTTIKLTASDKPQSLDLDPLLELLFEKN